MFYRFSPFFVGILHLEEESPSNNEENLNLSEISSEKGLVLYGAM
jgi:hypothetical protein